MTKEILRCSKLNYSWRKCERKRPSSQPVNSWGPADQRLLTFLNAYWNFGWTSGSLFPNHWTGHRVLHLHELLGLLSTTDPREHSALITRLCLICSCVNSFKTTYIFLPPSICCINKACQLQDSRHVTFLAAAEGLDCMPQDLVLYGPTNPFFQKGFQPWELSFLFNTMTIYQSKNFPSGRKKIGK